MLQLYWSEHQRVFYFQQNWISYHLNKHFISTFPLDRVRLRPKYYRQIERPHLCRLEYTQHWDHNRWFFQKLQQKPIDIFTLYLIFFISLTGLRPSMETCFRWVREPFKTIFFSPTLLNFEQAQSKPKASYVTHLHAKHDQNCQNYTNIEVEL